MIRPRILVLNNYSFDRVRGEVTRGDKPAHHLYGIEKLEAAGFEVQVIAFDETARDPRWWRTLQRLLPPLGNVRHQWQAWRRRHDFDLIYAPCQDQTQMLGYLRALGLFHVPILAVAHHPLVRGRLAAYRRWSARWQIRGTDAFPALSRGVAGEINAMSGGNEKSETLCWGPDLGFYPHSTTEPGTGAFAAGRTGRDFVTLRDAAVEAGSALHVVCLADDAVMRHGGSGQDRITLVPATSGTELSYRSLLPAMSAARVHAVPLIEEPSLAGLTSLTDALALGKPVIMTRHRLIDIDLEAEGIGRWTDPGDVKGWAEALRWFDEHPGESLAMGRKARNLAESLWNDQTFAKQIEAICRRLLPAAA